MHEGTDVLEFLGTLTLVRCNFFGGALTCEGKKNRTRRYTWKQYGAYTWYVRLDKRKAREQKDCADLQKATLAHLETMRTARKTLIDAYRVVANKWAAELVKADPKSKAAKRAEASVKRQKNMEEWRSTKSQKFQVYYRWLF